MTGRSGVAGLALALVQAALPAPGATADAFAGSDLLTVHESVEYYPVAANTLAGFVERMQARSTADDDSASIARTRTTLQVRYRLDPGDAGCTVAGLAVELDIVMRLPHWEGPAVMRPEIRDQWERMKAGIQRHEQGHRDIAVDAGRFLVERLAALPTAGKDCRAVDRAILRERIKAQMRHQNVDAAYDRRTRHGITQAPRPDDAAETRQR